MTASPPACLSDPSDPRLRARVHRALRPRPDGTLPGPLKLIVALIVVAVVLGVLGTEPTIHGHPVGAAVLSLADRVLFAAFAVEYLLRLWSAGERPRFAGWRGRLRWIVRPTSLIDLVVLVLLGLAVAGGDVFLLRLVRLARVAALARLGGLTPAGRAMGEALRARAPELLVSTGIALLAMLIAAAALHLVEGHVQPEAFGSVPRALWWSVATLTTVGYGDAYPVTALGKLIAGGVALLGIGVIALPTGILAAAFSDALQRRREAGGPSDPGPAPPPEGPAGD